MKTVHQAIVDVLTAQGVESVFGLIGEDTLGLCVEIDRRGITYYSARHESVAVGMADGYARVSGRLGVAVISRGPGLTNAISGIVSAMKAQSGVVVFTGDAPVQNAPKYVDHEGLMRSVGVTRVSVDSAESAAADVAAVCERARAGLTIVVDLSRAILELEAGEAPAQVELPLGGRDPAPEPDAITLVADLLGESWAVRHPIVLAGRGAVLSEAKHELERLAGLCGALLSTSYMAKSYFRGNPWDIGSAGISSEDEHTIELLANADLVLAFGISLNAYTTANGELFPNARFVHFDADPQTFGRHMEADLTVLGDARLSAKALADELERRGHEETGYRTDEVAAKIAASRTHRPTVDRGLPGALDAEAVMRRLEDVLPTDRMLVVDNGHQATFASANLSVPDPQSYIWPVDFGCIGAGTGIAIGAAVARPDRMTIFAQGDVGMMMTLGDLETAARYDLPLLVLLLNDRALGAELQFLQIAGQPDDVARVPTPSFEAVARALGLDAATVESMDDLDTLAPRLASMRGPFLVEIKVDPDIRASWVDWFVNNDRRGATEPQITARPNLMGTAG
jgi:acetolactate synthase-1/2/3 large subunit